MNVTVPLKEEAYRAASEHTTRAELAGAANTITVTAAGIARADNTDGSGLVRDLISNCGVTIAGRRVVLLGAGGAARGVTPSLLAEGPDEVLIVNRTRSKAETLVEQFRGLGRLRACDYTALAARPHDLLINATSLGLSGKIPPLPRAFITATTWCYDMMYTVNGRTAFLDWCTALGAAATRDGLGMLVEQAADAFSIWHGVVPDTAPVIAAIREQS